MIILQGLFFPPVHTHCDRRYPLLHVVCYSGVQVETMLSLKGSRGRSLVAKAAYSGNKAMFEAVSTTIGERLTPEMVTYQPVSTENHLCTSIMFHNRTTGPVLCQGYSPHQHCCRHPNCYVKIRNEKLVGAIGPDLIAICDGTETLQK